MRYLKYLLGGLLSAALVACGGGGGSGGTPGSGTGTGGGVVTPPATPTISVGLVNNSGAAVTSINVGGAFKAQATLKDAAGAVIAGRLVTFALSDETIAKLTPTTALTNTAGVAEVAIEPGSLSALGAGSLKATATVDASSVEGSTDFAVSASSLTLSPLTSSASLVASGGNATLAVTALIAGAPAAGVPVNVAFSASCGRINGSDASAGGIGVTTSGGGLAQVIYTAVTGDGMPCSGPVALTATSAGAASQSTTINVAAPTANTVTFVGAQPQQIFIAGTGAIEQSVVRFRVLSSAGTSLASEPVRLSIAVNPGGVGIGASGAAGPVVVSSDQDGVVSISLFSGTIPGPVRLRAELVANPLVFAESQNLTVASGPPSQRFMSLAVSRGSLEGWSIDGTPTTLTVRLADRQGNAVEDGTVVNFTAEGGQVARSCATTRVNGLSSCSVDFVTQNPRTTGGRVSVLAHTSGTKDYVDVNGNNVFDPGIDQLAVVGDAYRDDNENGVADLGEFYVPRGSTGACPSVGGAFPSKADTCDSGLATTVRQQAILLFGSTEPLWPVDVASAGLVQMQAGVGGVSFWLRSADNPLLPMPAGTNVTATGSPTSCTVTKVNGAPVADIRAASGEPNRDLATRVSVELDGCASGNRVSISVTSPSGLTSTFGVTLP